MTFKHGISYGLKMLGGILYWLDNKPVEQETTMTARIYSYSDRKKKTTPKKVGPPIDRYKTSTSNRDWKIIDTVTQKIVDSNMSKSVAKDLCARYNREGRKKDA